MQNQEELPVKPEEYLSKRAGICGRQVMTFREILNRLGSRKRQGQGYARFPDEYLHNELGLVQLRLRRKRLPCAIP